MNIHSATLTGLSHLIPNKALPPHQSFIGVRIYYFAKCLVYQVAICVVCIDTIISIEISVQAFFYYISCTCGTIIAKEVIFVITI